MTHKEKVKIANRIRSKQDIWDHTGKFLTDNWANRKEAIRLRIKNRIKKIKDKRKI